MKLGSIALLLMTATAGIGIRANLPGQDDPVTATFGASPIETGTYSERGTQRLIPKRDGVCFLQAVSGSLEGYGEGVAVLHGEGSHENWWVVTIKKTNPWQLQATVYCYRFR